MFRITEKPLLILNLDLYCKTLISYRALLDIPAILRRDDYKIERNEDTCIRVMRVK